MLLVVASTGDELFRNVNIDHLKWPWIPLPFPKWGV